MRFRPALLFLFAGLIWFAFDSPVNAQHDHPNVLLILTDDQGWGDLASHGNERISTPTLDRLSKQSVRLDRFYVSPVCAPTRAALLTGRYPERSGVAGVTGRREVMRANETTLAELFRDSGYATGCFGKWHNGSQMPLHPNGQGFEEFFGFCGGHFNVYDNPLLERNRIPVQTKGYITDILADAAIEFIKEKQNSPFFCYVPFNAPHGPFQVRKDLFDKYNTGDVSEKTAAVYAMVENIDTNVERLLKTLDETSLSEKTIVIFLTDNGPNGKRYNGEMRGAKGSVHEGGCRVPCFIRWPGQLEPQTLSQITAHIDLLPTLADWCSLDMPQSLSLDGQNLNSLIREGDDAGLNDRTILTYRPNQMSLETFGKAAVRTNTHRLTIEKGKPQLFDMGKDPSQSNNIAAAHPKIASHLTSIIKEYVGEITPSITSARRIPVDASEPTFIPSIDATLEGEPGFADDISWSHSWVDRWTSTEDRVSWPLQVAESGRYQIVLHYACDSKNASVLASFKGSAPDAQVIETKLDRIAIESMIRPDLDSESTPRRMLSFGQRSLGTVTMNAGETTLTLQRTDSDGDMIELGGVTVTQCDVPSKEKFHLYLLAGQSNMAGRGKVTPADKVPDARILMLDKNGHWVPATDPLHFDKSIAGVGMGRGFARNMLDSDSDVTIGLVPCAVGGSPISTWAEGGYHKSTRTHPYDDAKQRIETALRDGTFKGILWHQGESDSNSKQSSKYKDALKDTILRLRTLVGSETPVLIGELAHAPERPWNEFREQVDQAHQELAKELPHAAYVDSDDLTTKSDQVHFDRKSMLTFGRRYAEALKRINHERE